MKIVGFMMTLAPIGISVYTRLDHFSKCVEALQNNTLANDTDLYVFSDAAVQGDESEVEDVREYARKIKGFKKVNIIERPSNFGAYENQIIGLKLLVENFGRCIFMEDDNVTAPGFLSFMNEALDYYKDDQNVCSITGYSLPINIPDNYNCEVYVAARMIAWGLGVFPRTLEIIQKPIERDEYENIKDKSIFKSQGKDVPHMIKAEIEERVNAGDIRAAYHQIMNDQYTVFPRKSLVQNIGNDGSGYTMKGTDRYYHVELWDKTKDFVFEKNIKTDPDVQMEFTKFWNKGYYETIFKINIVSFLRMLGIYDFLKKMLGRKDEDF